MTDASDRLFLVGPGYSAQYLADIWPCGAEVSGTFRGDKPSPSIKWDRIKPVSVADTKALELAVQGAHVLISVPPSGHGDPAFDLLQAHIGTAKSLTYLSTTGVYGDRKGGWVFEWTEPSPDSERGRARCRAERAWIAARSDACIVRLPGIYGPDRSVFERLKDGTAQRIIKPGQVFSRIHVEDIASGLKALILGAHDGVFHLCDDEAAPPQDPIAYGANLLGMPPPPDISYECADLSPMARSFYSECKRVSNARIKAATGWRPAYPTYREGLRAIAESL